MRFVDRHLLLARGATFALAAALSACASLPDPVALVKQVIAPAEETKPAEAAKPADPTPAERAAADKTRGAATAPAAPVQAEPEVPVDPRAQAAFDTARRAMRAGRHDEAERQLKALAASHPELGGVHANLGLIYRHAGKLPEA